MRQRYVIQWYVKVQDIDRQEECYRYVQDRVERVSQARFDQILAETPGATVEDHPCGVTYVRVYQ